MKRLVIFALVLAMAVSLPFGASAAQEKQAEISCCGISIAANGFRLDTGENQPFIMDGYTYLPVRAVADALGLDVNWDEVTSTITLSSGGAIAGGAPNPKNEVTTRSVRITYRDIKLVVDGRQAALQGVQPFIMDGYTYLPVRAVADALGYEVFWENDTKTVILISDPERTQTETICAYDRAGQDVISVSARSEYYCGGRLVFAETSDGAAEIYIYSPGGALESRMISAEGTEKDSYTVYAYDVSGVLTRSDSYTGRTTTAVHSIRSTYTYDENGLLVKEYVHYPDASWSDTRYEYDEGGRLISEKTQNFDILAQNHSYSTTEYFYDEAGRLTRSDTLGFETVYSYDADGRITRSVKAGLGGIYTIVTYSYS